MCLSIHVSICLYTCVLYSTRHQEEDGYILNSKTNQPTISNEQKLQLCTYNIGIIGMKIQLCKVKKNVTDLLTDTAMMSLTLSSVSA